MSEIPAQSKTPGNTQAEPLIQRKHVIIATIVVLLLLAAVVTLVILAVRNPVHTETFRDIAIIALAAESGLIGLALLVLIVQVARLTNMLEFEIKPILENTSDTVSTVRGTATFLSERMVAPVIKASGYASGASRLVAAVAGLFRIGGQKNMTESAADSDLQDTDGGTE
jgi:NADH:ubiquinone oxidoreductase subunit K